MPSGNIIKEIAIKRKSRTGLSLLTALSFSLIVFIVSPFDIFANNFDEFLFSLGDFIGVSVLFCLLSTLIIFSVLFFIPDKAYKIVLYLFIATSFMFIVQQNFLNFNLNSLGGDNMGEGATSVFLKILDVLIWAGVYTGAVLLAIRKDEKSLIQTIATVLSVVILSVQIVSPLSIAISNSRVFSGKSFENSLNVSSLKDFTSMSERNNIYFFVIDRFDENYAEQAYGEDSNVYSEFQGFTWFQDNIALYGHTFPAIANMLTYKEYNPELPREEYLNQVYMGDTPLKYLKDSGYSINIYTENYYAYDPKGSLPDYFNNFLLADNYKSNNSFMVAGYLVTFSMYRLTPYFVKNIFANGTSDSCNRDVDFYDENGEIAKFDLDTKEVFENMENSDFTVKKGGKSFHFIHFNGCHNIDYDDDWGKPDKNTKITSSVRNSLKIVNEFIEELKKNNLYDSATIIVTGDHSRPVNDYKNVNEPRRTALFVKPSGRSSGFNISQAQTSHKNIWATVLKSENLDYSQYGSSVFEIPENENQTRHFFWHTYNSRDNSLDVYEYDITGKSTDFNNWHETSTAHFDRFLMD